MAIPQEVTVGLPLRFCNPVQKKYLGETTPINNPTAHLTLYDINDFYPGPVVRVTYRTQFGKRSVNLWVPAYILAVPTAKESDIMPADLDHFKCYAADGRAPRNPQGNPVTVRLTDQFGVQRNTQIGRAILWCNPAEKTHGTTVTPIEHPNQYLVCYWITVKPLVEGTKILNQFQSTAIAVGNGDVICVPAKFKKVEVL